LVDRNYKEVYSPILEGDLSERPLDEFAVFEAKKEEADRIIKTYHYLTSAREESVNLALIYLPKEYIAGVITISKFDLAHIQIKPLLSSEAKVISRIFTFPRLPPNTASHFIGETIRWIRKRSPAVKLLLTYLNPNVGYQGTIYKATNWKGYAREHNTRYSYFDGNYVTDRFLQKRFGTAARERLGNVTTLEFSKIDLYPLMVLAYPLSTTVQLRCLQDVHLDRR
jgi:hypothetical protein